MLNLNRHGNCSAYAGAVKFVDAFINDVEASTRITAKNAAPLTSLAPFLTQRLNEAMCDGQYVYPRASPSSDQTTIITIAVVVSCVVVFVAAIGAVLWWWMRQSTRNIQLAPKDAAKPFAVAFTDIQSSTALWAQIPAVMAPALDAHHAMIRRLISKYEAYEVKTIGDAFMIASSSLERLLPIALEIQDEFKAHDWGTDLIDELYRQQAEEMRETTFGVPCAVDSEEYRTLWSGLRVRVGVHYGFGDIRLDQVSKGYDYYGSVVNTAARVESIAHGGQVLLSAAALDALQETNDGRLLSSEMVVLHLGKQTLKGLDEPVSIQQVSRGPLVGRHFPPLRLDKAEVLKEADANKSSNITANRSENKSVVSTGDGGINEDLKSTVIGVLMSALGNSDRKKAMRILCDAWRIPFNGSSAALSEAASSLWKRVGPILSEKMKETQSGPRRRQHGTLNRTGSFATMDAFPTMDSSIVLTQGRNKFSRCGSDVVEMGSSSLGRETVADNRAS